VNEYRTARVAEILDDFRTLQYYIAAAPTSPINSEDHYTEGWAALRQCAIDGQHILECAADTSVPNASGGEEEQRRAELKQYAISHPHLAIFSFRRAAKIRCKRCQCQDDQLTETLSWLQGLPRCLC
jgi:hypothetical protein